MGGWAWRIKVELADNFTTLVVAALLLTSLGGYLTYTSANSNPTETVVRETSSWESSGEFTHRATVVNDTAAFEEGTVLRNRPVYFFRVMPILNGSFVYGYRASEGGQLDANTSVALRYQSVGSGGDGSQEVYWRVERPLNESTATLSPGEQAETSFSVNASRAAAEAERIDDQLGGAPGQLQVTLVASVDLRGTRNGQPVETTRVYRSRIVPSEGTYSVRDAGPRTIPGNQTTRETVPVEPDPLRTRGGPALLAVGLLGLGGLSAVRWTGLVTVTDAQRELSGFQDQREEFDEWITTGRLPDSTFEHPRIEVDSLGGLVDVAIDSECRVIEDTERDVFAVLADGYRYMYYPPKGPVLADRSDGDDTAGTAGESTAEEATDSPEREGDTTDGPPGEAESSGTDEGPTGEADTDDDSTEPDAGSPDGRPRPDTD